MFDERRKASTRGEAVEPHAVLDVELVAQPLSFEAREAAVVLDVELVPYLRRS